jgi:hypothetical protein
MSTPTPALFSQLAADLVNQLRAEPSITERQRLLTELRDLRSKRLEALSTSTHSHAARLALLEGSMRYVSRRVDWTTDPPAPGPSWFE